MRSCRWICLLSFAVARSAEAQEPPATVPPADGNGNGDGDDEIVEVIEDETDTGKPAAPRPEPEAPKPDKIEVRGFGRTTLQYGLPSEGPAPVNAPLSDHVGYERATSVSQMYLDVRYNRGKSFQAVISGSLAYTASLVEGRAGEPLDSRTVSTVLLEPVLREAYLGFYSERVDVRLGQQRIVWGNADGVAPNDVLNARDTRNRMQLDAEMVAIPTLAARADFDIGVAVLGLVAQPFFFPDRASFYGANWSLVQPDAPLHVRRFFGTYGDGKDPGEVEAALVRFRQQNLFDGASLGASMRMHFASFDTSLYYHYGRDRSPYVYLDPQIAQQFNQARSPENPTGEEFEAIYAGAKRASASYGGPFVSTSVRRHHVGMDMSTTAGPLVLRLDAAFDTAMTFYTRDNLNSIAKPTAQAVAGVEYQRGFGKVIVLEASYMHILGPEVPVIPVVNQANSGPLLFVREQNAAIANVVRWLFWDYVVLEARSLLGINPLSWVVRPEVGYAGTNFTLRLGYLMIDGAGGSFGSWFRRNETVYLTTRYSF
ncbi:MAG: hypothetical protein KIT84_26630 [Labilithrix sp.]|nr:hypothetical protein [Labilithrix sp.]MCW5814630.1 hypothetical protein [Labilithrix sp.]